METPLQKMEESVKKNIDAKKEAINQCTKFQQTLTTSQESPIYEMSEHNAREKDQSKTKGIIIKYFHDFLNNDSSKNEDMEMIISDETEKENLELLTDKLIQVLNFNNIDKRIDLQKEDLIQ